MSLTKLAEYKKTIDEDIASFAEYIHSSTLDQYGKFVTEAEVDIFLDILQRGGKRIRGALVMAGYEMCGGRDTKMIVQAARAIEMLHASMLMIDDIQDRSDLRRGKPSAHKMLEAYHEKHGFKGDAFHTGISVGMMAAVSGSYAAESVIANLNVEPELRLKALSITNRTLVITSHGQTLDIINELVDQPSDEDVERVLEWKTALYSIINPLHVGMVLAGGGCEVTDAITPYGLHAGKAFQITDDILGIFGEEKELGKTPGDDIREGKGTVLAMYALKHADTNDKKFLLKSLGNPELTAQDFEKCKEIIQNSGALAHARGQAVAHLHKALHILDEVDAQKLWSQDGTAFLRELTLALQNRVS
jgi:geranylgeranyl diphosphate synthase type I